ncbi:coiled-coil domain-containing protein 141-like [Entelurus aequoreus]|uniref:coiled-coil domain-containing protein 141-like n=1 Tax=Entelurus aequoreus TaxID=161455 RepID=UPI002B1DBC0B|nr:coiled-coil domain-containing protein 141-like [Entelurus aequoreus]
MTSSIEPEVATLRGHKDTGETKTDNGKSFTTLSTIAIQTGQSQLVVSVVKSGSLVHLELIQVQPELCEIGSNQEENRTLMQEHEKLMKTMKKHQQEVVEAAGEIGRKRRRQEEDQEVYEAMGACLNEGWYNLLRVLERRQEVLTLAASFYQAASQLLLGVDNVEDTLLRVDVGFADATLALDAMRRDVLRSSLKVLLSGGQLLRELELLQRTDSLRGASVVLQQHTSHSLTCSTRHKCGLACPALLKSFLLCGYGKCNKANAMSHVLPRIPDPASKWR